MESGVGMGDLPSFSRARFSFSRRSLSFLFFSLRCFSASFRSFIPLRELAVHGSDSGERRDRGVPLAAYTLRTRRGSGKKGNINVKA